MRVGLFVPCYIDQFYPDVAMATVEILEGLGIEVIYPEEQTCCGQPALNSGDSGDARAARFELTQKSSDFLGFKALRDLLAAQERLVTMENIQKTVAEYFKIRVADLLSKRRSRSIARPRQVAMALARELTNHSLPEIGDAFGGRDHTTVLHACRVMKELRTSQQRLNEDYSNLLRTLAG
mgnify:CR=1 FL=1